MAGKVQEKQLPALIEKLVNKLRKAEQVHSLLLRKRQGSLGAAHRLSLLEEKMEEVVAVPAPPPVAEVILGRVGPIHPYPLSGFS